MTPITKNIIVVDEQGNTYGSTYPKRAKGLVNKGRARFIDEHTICLAYPPDINMEEFTMSENLNNNSNIGTSNNENRLNIFEGITVKYILDKIAEISRNTDHITAAVNMINQIDLDSLEDAEDSLLQINDIVDNIRIMVDDHEITNCNILSMYQKIYDDVIKAAHIN